MAVKVKKEQVTPRKPNLHNLVAGALYDFVGFLIAQDNEVLVGAQHSVTPILALLKVWANERDLDLKHAEVQHWEAILDLVPVQREIDRLSRFIVKHHGKEIKGGDTSVMIVIRLIEEAGKIQWSRARPSAQRVTSRHGKDCHCDPKQDQTCPTNTSRRRLARKYLRQKEVESWDTKS